MKPGSKERMSARATWATTSRCEVKDGIELFSTGLHDRRCKCVVLQPEQVWGLSIVWLLPSLTSNCLTTWLLGLLLWTTASFPPQILKAVGIALCHTWYFATLSSSLWFVRFIHSHFWDWWCQVPVLPDDRCPVQMHPQLASKPFYWCKVYNLMFQPTELLVSYQSESLQAAGLPSSSGSFGDSLSTLQSPGGSVGQYAAGASGVWVSLQHVIMQNFQSCHKHGNLSSLAWSLPWSVPEFLRLMFANWPVVKVLGFVFLLLVRFFAVAILWVRLSWYRFLRSVMMIHQLWSSYSWYTPFVHANDSNIRCSEGMKPL